LEIELASQLQINYGALDVIRHSDTGAFGIAFTH
jgi:hypothetical protein